jgi:dihydroflavonol-4-reductase
MSMGVRVMNGVLVTGATSFLGYHVVKRLNESGVRPRVLERRDSKFDVLDRVTVDQCAGYLEDQDAVRSACSGVDTLLHLAFKVSVGGGAQAVEEMQRINVDGTRALLQAASAAGVRRAVVTGSALAVGVNRQPTPLDESASWSEHEFDLPYAKMRRQVELDAIAQANAGFAVLTVCPSFTFGPDDPSGAPANKLLTALMAGKVPAKLAVGFGCLDVRDFAKGMVLAGERGRSGERYLLSGTNITTDRLVEEVASITGVSGPRFTAPSFLVKALVGGLEVLSGIRGKPPAITRDVLQILGRYAWYDSSKARRELGWTPRPLHETLADTIGWLRGQNAQPAAAAARAGT